MSELIGTAQALELLDKVVQAKGADYVYPGQPGDLCFNFETDGAPSCIVGHVLADLGLTYERASRLKVVGSSGAHDTVQYLVADGFPYTFSVGAMCALYVAQTVQDQRESWGAALDAARKASADYLHNEQYYGRPYVKPID